MQNGGVLRSLVTASLLWLGLTLTAHAASLPGTGELSGRVSGNQPDLLATVYALNTDRDVGYMVYVVNGRYRATTLFPGNYEVAIRPAVGQLFEKGFEPQTHRIRIEGDEHASLDFELEEAIYEPDYVGGMFYQGGWTDKAGMPSSPDAEVLPYDEDYPPGRGREIMENTCFGCHTIQLYPYNYTRTYPTGRPLHDKAGWAITVDRMHKGVAFSSPGKPSYFDEKYLTPEDREIVIDYLAENFGPDSKPRVVQLESEPELDLEALEKAQFIEYRFFNTEEKPTRFTQQIDFDAEGNVWVSDRGCPCIVKVDPRTGEYTDYMGYGGGHGIAVDQHDGAVWFSSMYRLDPDTGLADTYGVDGGQRLGANTHIFDSNGDLWMSALGAGALTKWERKTDSIKYWEVPILRSRPYGIIVDHNDKVWFSEYHNSGVARFDPVTEEFTHFQLEEHLPTNMRRPGVDSKNHIWQTTWGSRGMQDGALYGLNPETGEVLKRRIVIDFTNPYTVEADEFDNLWIGTDNYLVKYDQEADEFTRYPLTVRTDIPKVTMAQISAVWFTPRNAGQSSDYGGAASVLHPDKDAIESFAARFYEHSAANRLKHYDGPPGPKVKGVEKLSPCGAQNEGEYARAMGLPEDSMPDLCSGPARGPGVVE